MAACIACHLNEPFGRYSMLCGLCFGHARRDLAKAHFAYLWLGAELVALPARQSSGSVHASAGPRPPLSLDRHDMRVQIQSVLWSWTRLVLEELVPALRGPQVTDVPTVARWLGERLPWVSDQPWADEFVRELHELCQKAYVLAPWDRSRADLAAPCPDCGLLTLTRYSGADGVYCRNAMCCRVLLSDEYTSLVTELNARFGKLKEPIPA